MTKIVGDQPNKKLDLRYISKQPMSKFFSSSLGLLGH